MAPNGRTIRICLRHRRMRRATVMPQSAWGRRRHQRRRAGVGRSPVLILRIDLAVRLSGYCESEVHYEAVAD
jgi:hypothetical protein